MASKDSTHPPDPLRIPVIPSPVALYISNGLIFELYDGGQPVRPFSIQWDRVNAIEEEPTETDVSPHQFQVIYPQ